ncbi:MAG: magnesium transporter, partial [bacterium]|nr:magnesium transporter [bacterium]
PIIVYLSDAVGTQTETIYVRALAHKKKLYFRKYILKESAIGVALGIIFGGVLGIFAGYWLNSQAIGVTIGLAAFINLSIAPAVALFISNTIRKQHRDPALGAGPVGTIFQDLISILVYFTVASIIVF